MVNQRKATAFFLFAILFGAFLISWGSGRPDKFLSTLDYQFDLGEAEDCIIAHLQNLGFENTIFEYSNDQFIFISGEPSALPLLTFPSAPSEQLSVCNEVDCSIISSRRIEDIHILGFLRFHHTYRYLWIFHGHKLASASHNNGYWAFIR